MRRRQVGECVDEFLASVRPPRRYVVSPYISISVKNSDSRKERTDSSSFGNLVAEGAKFVLDVDWV